MTKELRMPKEFIGKYCNDCRRSLYFAEKEEVVDFIDALFHRHCVLNMMIYRMSYMVYTDTKTIMALREIKGDWTRLCEFVGDVLTNIDKFNAISANDNELLNQFSETFIKK